MDKSSLLTGEGTFFTGCNYWASHAGTAMWSDWQPEIVEKDLKLLAESGIKVLRVFPLWPDFQPIVQLYGEMGKPQEIRIGENVPEESEMGRAGVSPTAMEHFEELIHIAEKHQIKLVIGIITGWMSGMLHVPPALAGRNILTDPLSLKWQVRFVKCFVKHFMDFKAVIAWDLGNECNCMAEIPGRDAAWLWTSSIVGAIRVIDPARPVVSGMHSLLPEGSWTIQDQGELTDILTTHPYPLFSPHCDRDSINTMRSLIHATAESLFNSNIAGKPCFAEEIGTLGPMIASERIVADFARTNMFSLWAHDCRGFLWWCAYDQLELTHAPYDWCAIERELGLIRSNGTLKPVAEEMKRFSEYLGSLPFDSLPKRLTEGVCILTDEQDHWGVAFSSFILAKQAGFDIEFQYHVQSLKKSSLYFLPCITGLKVLSREKWLELMESIYEGATLYISYDGGFLSQFEEITGLEVQTRQRNSGPVRVSMDGLPGCPAYEMNAAFGLTLKPVRAEVLGTDDDNNPVFTCAQYGKGKVYFLSLPIEIELANLPLKINCPESEAYWKIYRQLLPDGTGRRVISNAPPLVGMTEHPIDDRYRIIVMINYSPMELETSVTTATGFNISKVLYGTPPRMSEDSTDISIKANDALVFIVERKNEGGDK